RQLRLAALALARELGDIDAAFEAADVLLNTGATPPALHAELLRLAEELWALRREGSNVSGRTYALRMMSQGFLSWGDRARREQCRAEATAVAATTRDANAQVMPWQFAIEDAILAGQLEEALALRAQAMARAEELGVPVAGQGLVMGQALRAFHYLGRGQE